MTEIEVVCDDIENKNTENKDTENKDIENKDTIPKAGMNAIIQVDKKPIKKLTNNEKDIIINNAKNGIENQYYDVLMFKNGNSRIVKKKCKTLTV